MVSIQGIRLAVWRNPNNSFILGQICNYYITMFPRAILCSLHKRHLSELFHLSLFTFPTNQIKNCNINIFARKFMQDLSFSFTRNISPTLNDISMVLRRSFAENDGPFWCPEEFKNVANPDFKNLKNLQNPRHLFLTIPSIRRSTLLINH